MKPKGDKAMDLLFSRIGTKADIHIEAGLYKGHYGSSLEDVDGGLLALAHPLRKEGLLPVYRDVEFGIFFLDEKTPIYVKALSKRCDLSGQIPILWAELLGPVERIQRRRFLRVPCMLPTEFWVLDEEMAHPLSGVWRPGRVLDISLGGVRLQYSDKKRSLKEEMETLFFLPLQDTSFLCGGKVVWAPPKKDEDFFEIGLEFGGVSRLMEKALQAFIREKEIANRD